MPFDEVAPGEAAPLAARISHLEKRILDRQQHIRRYASACRNRLWNRLASTPMLLSAVAAGFTIGALAWRKPSAPDTHADASVRTGKWWDGALKAIAVIRTVVPNVLSAARWLFPEAGASSRSAQGRQPASAASNETARR